LEIHILLLTAMIAGIVNTECEASQGWFLCWTWL